MPCGAVSIVFDDGPDRGGVALRRCPCRSQALSVTLAVAAELFAGSVEEFEAGADCLAMELVGAAAGRVGMRGPAGAW